MPSRSIRKLSPMQKRVQFKMAQQETNLDASGLSKNHQQLSEEMQSLEKKTRLRRAQPLYPSQVLGDSFKYGGKQLERKAPRHLLNFGFSIQDKTIQEMANEYRDLIEMLLSKPNLITHQDGTLNKQESTINIGDPESRIIVAFENNSLYEDHHFISAYSISDEAFKTFEETGNIGSSPEERAQEINKFQKAKAQAEREKTASSSFYNSLPEDARIGNEQLRQVKSLQEQLKQDPSISLTEKEKRMIQRAEKYQQYKTKFYQDTPFLNFDSLLLK